jgi:hypothetical protein
MASAETSVSVKMLRGEDLLPAISSRHQSKLGRSTHGPSHCFAVVASLWNDSTYAPLQDVSTVTDPSLAIQPCRPRLARVSVYGFGPYDSSPRGKVSPMSIATHLSDSEHWRQRAEASRVLAELMTDETLKKMMHTIADDCEKFAARASEPLIDE